MLGRFALLGMPHLGLSPDASGFVLFRLCFGFTRLTSPTVLRGSWKPCRSRGRRSTHTSYEDLHMLLGFVAGKPLVKPTWFRLTPVSVERFFTRRREGTAEHTTHIDFGAG